MSAGIPVSCASATASAKLPALPRLRKPVILILPGWPRVGSAARSHPSAQIAGRSGQACRLTGSRHRRASSRDRTRRRGKSIARIPFRRRTVGVAPAVGGVVEGTGVDNGPVQEIGFRVVGVAVGVEDVIGAEAAGRDDRRSADRVPLNCVKSSSTFSVSPPRSMVWRRKARCSRA